MTRVLFVCLGNICRSPTAESVLRARAEARGLAVTADSCGTSDWHLGDPPYPPAIAAAARRGYDLTPLRARRLTAEDFDRFDLILTADRSVHDSVLTMAPRGARARVHLMMGYAPQTGHEDLPDPYYTHDFDQTLDLVEAVIDGLLARLGPDQPAQ